MFHQQGRFLIGLQGQGMGPGVRSASLWRRVTLRNGLLRFETYP